MLGHEIAGEVVEVGLGVTSVASGVTSLAPGERVTAYYYLACGDCRWCRMGREPLCPHSRGTIGRAIDGGYADYCVLPAWNLVPLPASLPYADRPAEVAVISDAIVTPVKVARRARIAALQRVAVIGAGGGVGIQMVQVAKLHQARVVAADLGQAKLDLARQMGADEVVDAANQLRSDMLGECDVVIDFVGSPETAQAGLTASDEPGAT